MGSLDREERVKDSELIVIDGKIYHLGLRQDQLVRNIFVAGDPARADKIAAHFDSIEHRVNNREYVTRTGKYHDMPVMVISTGIGTDNNEITLIEAYGLNEFDLEKRIRKESAGPLTIIRIGTSGGLQGDIDVGTLAISEYGIGLDSTGLFYQQEAPDDFSVKLEEETYRMITEAAPNDNRFRGKIHPYVSKASPEVVESLAKSIKKDYVIGMTVTASGFFAPQGREIPGIKITIPKLQEHLATLRVDGKRVVNFEMESSLLFHLSAVMGYRCGTVCPIIANRANGTFLADYGPAVERAIQSGLDAMLELYQKDQKSY